MDALVRSVVTKTGASVVLVVALFAPAARAQTARRPAETVERKSDKDDAEKLRIGAIAGVGFPRPLAVEGLVKIQRVFALGLEYSVLPKTTIADVDTTFWALAGDARVFPFANGFFVGLRGGRQTLTASGTARLGSIGTFTESGRAETWFVNPRLGFLWTWQSGFSLGIDAGVQIPINPSLTTTLPPGTPAEVQSTIATIANTLGNRTTPTLDLVRIGFLF